MRVQPPRRATPREWMQFLRSVGARALAADVDGEPNVSAIHEIVRGLVPQIPGSRMRSLAMGREVAFARRWALSGFPMIEVAEKLFAQLVATTIKDKDDIPDVKAPWATFVVRIPDRFAVDLDWGDKNILPIDWMVYDSAEGGANLEMRPSDAPGAMGGIGFHHVSELWNPIPESVACDVDFWVNGETSATTEIPDRTLLLRHAFVGCLIELMTSSSRTMRIARAKRDGVREKRGLPRGWTFQLTRPVHVDCRDHVHAVLESAARGEKRPRKPPSVQCLVRGYWRRQHYGRGGALVRLQHIEPYWKGNADAPIAVRSHVLTKAG